MPVSMRTFRLCMLQENNLRTHICMVNYEFSLESLKLFSDYACTAVGDVVQKISLL